MNFNIVGLLCSNGTAKLHNHAWWVVPLTDWVSIKYQQQHTTIWLSFQNTTQSCYN